MKKLFFLIFFLPLISFAQTNAGYYTGAITYDTTNHTCCVEFLDSSSSNVSLMAWWWYFGDSTAPVTVPDYTHCFTDTGVYEVCLHVTDMNGVSDVQCCNFNFLDPDSAFLDCDSLTGTFEIFSDKIRLSPNPSKGSFTISGMQERNFEVRIINHLGKVVYNRYFNDGSTSCKIENLSPGTYIVMLLTREGILTRKQIVVQ